MHDVIVLQLYIKLKLDSEYYLNTEPMQIKKKNYD